MYIIYVYVYYVSVYVYVYVYACVYFNLRLSLSLYIYIYMPVCLSIYLSIPARLPMNAVFDSFRQRCEQESSRSVVKKGPLLWSTTWTPKVCRIIAFYGSWAIILPTFGGLGRAFQLWVWEVWVEVLGAASAN